jgi:SAM-dependent methyltransferase
MNREPGAERGTGPGVITPDGCAVELYRVLPAMGEPEVVHAAIPAGAGILELGAGAGRVTRRLVALGHPVVAVDESAEMLACVRGADARGDWSGAGSTASTSPRLASVGADAHRGGSGAGSTASTSAGVASVGAETVRARIQDLDLGRRFEVVLLASFLVNTDDGDLRRRFLEACRRHVGEGGCVLVQRHPPAWFDEAVEGERTDGGITFRLRDLSRPGPGLLAATAEYQVGERVWTQTFTAERLDDEALAAALAEAGLAVDAYLTGDGSWVRAVPLARGRALGRSPR